MKTAFANVSIYIISALICPIIATFFKITASFLVQFSFQIRPFPIGNGERNAVFHSHLVLSTSRRDDFRNLDDVNEDMVVYPTEQGRRQ